MKKKGKIERMVEFAVDIYNDGFPGESFWLLLSYNDQLPYRHQKRQLQKYVKKKFANAGIMDLAFFIDDPNDPVVRDIYRRYRQELINHRMDDEEDDVDEGIRNF